MSSNAAKIRFKRKRSSASSGAEMGNESRTVLAFTVRMSAAMRSFFAVSTGSRLMAHVLSDLRTNPRFSITRTHIRTAAATLGSRIVLLG